VDQDHVDVLHDVHVVVADVEAALDQRLQLAAVVAALPPLPKTKIVLPSS
jgi:hypothetical protein